MSLSEEIENASVFGQKLEDFVVNRGSVSLGAAPTRSRLLLAYWALSFDFDKSILALIRTQFYGGAFALLRSLVEAEVRAHVVLMGTDEEVSAIARDDYRTNFATIGTRIDTAFGLKGFFDRFLNGSRGALHSFTHSGLSQLGRRFNGDDLVARYDDGEIIEVIRTSSTAMYMVTNLVTNYFGFEEEKRRVNDLFLEWGRSNQIRERAYEIYLGRNRQDGFALDDWLQAEREIPALTPS